MPSASKRQLQVDLLTIMTQSLESALYFVATPIGAARDITLRGLDILARADVLAAEDTRNTKRLLDIHGVDLGARWIVPYHDHNGAAQRPKLIAALKEGKSVAYMSDAGTPLIADPGFALARDVIAAGLKVRAAPGASALLTALAVAGLPTDRFFFAGFLPPKTGARQKELGLLAPVPGTLVFYESPKRIHGSLTDMVQVLGGDRQAAVCRELTKKFEECGAARSKNLRQAMKIKNRKVKLWSWLVRHRRVKSARKFWKMRWNWPCCAMHPCAMRLTTLLANSDCHANASIIWR